MGALLAFAYGNIVSRFSDVPSPIVMQFIGAFGAWILADLLALSGVLVVVTFAVILSRAAIRLPAAVRVPSYAVWELAVFVLNALAFILEVSKSGRSWTGWTARPTSTTLPSRPRSW